jgi:hypothetical protein
MEAAMTGEVGREPLSYRTDNVADVELLDRYTFLRAVGNSDEQALVRVARELAMAAFDRGKRPIMDVWKIVNEDRHALHEARVRIAQLEKERVGLWDQIESLTMKRD